MPTCPNCGIHVNPWWNYCCHCGINLKRQKWARTDDKIKSSKDDDYMTPGDHITPDKAIEF